MADIPILSAIFGRKPQVAGWTNLQLSDAQLQALKEDLTLLLDPKFKQFGNLWQDYIMSEYNRVIPGFGKILSGISGATGNLVDEAGQLIQGVIPKDVMQRIYSSSAAQNLASGLMGAPGGIANTARNLGLTSLDLIGQGANLLGSAQQRWSQLGNFAQTTMAPVQNMLVSPEQQFNVNWANAQMQRSVQQQKYNIAAAPSPIAKGLSDLVAYLTASYVGSLGGGHGAAGQPPKAPDYSSLTFGSDYQGQGATGSVFPTTAPGYQGGPAMDFLQQQGGPTSINDQMTLPSASSGTDLSSLLAASGDSAGFGQSSGFDYGGFGFNSQLGQIGPGTSQWYPGGPTDTSYLTGGTLTG